MWLSKQLKPMEPAAGADLGVTTIAGDSVGVSAKGEVRNLPVYGPGGFVWLPESGNGVLVIKGGPGGEEQCVAGMKQASPPDGMLPGEIFLFAPGGASVFLRRDGSLEPKGVNVSIQGELSINGRACRLCDC